MTGKTKIIIAVGIFLGVIGALVYTSIGETATFYMTVDEIAVSKAKAVERPVKVSGKIVGESVEWDPENIILSFELEGESGKRVKVRYEGTKPDTLNDGWEAIVEGTFASNGTLEATDLLVKCPSKYEAMEEEGKTPPEDHQGGVDKKDGSE